MESSGTGVVGVETGTPGVCVCVDTLVACEGTTASQGTSKKCVHGGV